MVTYFVVAHNPESILMPNLSGVMQKEVLNAIQFVSKHEVVHR